MNIQDELHISPIESKDTKKSDKSGTEEESTLSFQKLVTDLSNSNEQKEASLQYYFICLLHLANENVSSDHF